ncbi:MAG: tRNA pseudouridine(38-40) synthase TruA [Phycisphaerales bacterium]
MPRYRLTIAYDGTDFHGWQRQPMDDDHARRLGVEPGGELRTVQGEVERAVRETLREPGINLLGASRTDAGVHALGQVAAFTSEPDPDRGVGWPAERGCDTLVRALNSRLDRDIVIRDADVTRDDFNPIADALTKEYTYTLAPGAVRPLWQRRYAFHTWYDLDPVRMHNAAQHLVGEHDFVSFAQINHGRTTTERTIHACSVEHIPADAMMANPLFVDPHPLVRIRVSGSGFLYNMVRIIAGTLMEIGRGVIEADAIPGILASKDRRAAGPTLPPQGLRLEWIRHRDP